MVHDRDHLLRRLHNAGAFSSHDLQRSCADLLRCVTLRVDLKTFRVFGQLPAILHAYVTGVGGLYVLWMQIAERGTRPKRLLPT